VIAATNSIDNWVALGLSVAGIFYLIMVLIFPERF
jgi:hypothetical protein